MKNNLIQDKTFAFAVKILIACRYLMEYKKEFILSKQLLKSGTSIGANVEEAVGGQSEKDFLSKLSIAYKEVRETIYWLKLLTAKEYFKDYQYSVGLLPEAEEIRRIIGKIQITMKSKSERKSSSNFLSDIHQSSTSYF